MHATLGHWCIFACGSLLTAPVWFAIGYARAVLRRREVSRA
jgi:hypothetical protein